MKTSCWFGHTWSKWEVVGRGETITEDGTIIGKYVRQEKYCNICGKIKSVRVDS